MGMISKPSQAPHSVVSLHYRKKQEKERKQRGKKRKRKPSREPLFFSFFFSFLFYTTKEFSKAKKNLHRQHFQHLILLELLNKAMARHM
jgi:hypothetical protein